MKKLLLLLLLVPVVVWAATDATKVYGLVRDATGTAYQGGTVTITMRSPTNLIDTTSAADSSIIVPVMALAAGDSDTLGYWSVSLIPSLDFADTVYYTFEFSWGGGIKDMLLIDTDSLNLADSIAGR